MRSGAARGLAGQHQRGRFAAEQHDLCGHRSRRRGTTKFDIWTVAGERLARLLLHRRVFAGDDPDRRPELRRTGERSDRCQCGGGRRRMPSRGRLRARSMANPNLVHTDNLSVTGYLWWSASNWADRLTVPLTFAPAANLCSVVGSSASRAECVRLGVDDRSDDPVGAALLPRHEAVHLPARPDAGAGGAHHLGCRQRLGRLRQSTRHTTTGPVVQAPVAVTGFAISYTIDDAKGHEYTKLRLNARLLAKLITESYPADQGRVFRRSKLRLRSRRQ